MKKMYPICVAKIIIFILLFAASNCADDNLNRCSSISQVRLVGGGDEREGRVEVCAGGEWGTVCDDLWDSNDAEVVCRMLGFETNGAIAVSESYFGQGSGPILLDNLECVGDEEELHLCPHLGFGTHDCSHQEDASVICQPANFSCEEGAVRLVGGERPTEGRVEICFGNQFGTICDDGWDGDDAAVICGQLGFSREGAIGVTRTAPFGIGIGYIYIDDVDCHGNEPNITSCPHRGLTSHNCRHSEDAGVLCKPLGLPTVCNNGDIRLVGGRYESEGRVEICFNERWGTICDDLWELSDARVVCRQKGFPSNGAIALSSNAFGPGTGPIFLDNLLCKGNENSLVDCFSTRPGEHNCDHVEDAGIVCQDQNIQCRNESVRLVNGTNGRLYEGRVEICINNHWGTVCDDSWSNEDAKVVCNQMGYPGPALALPRSFFGRGKGITWMTQVDCSGNESSLLSCDHNAYNSDIMCTHAEDANAICTELPENSTLCENGHVRLVDGSVSSEGRVEVCFNNYWGTVCANSWDDMDASVVCRQIGYEGEGSLATVNGFFGEGTGPILLDDVQCMGNESLLLHCSSVNQIGTHNCKHSQDVGVICPVSKGLCENGDVRLRGGSSEYEGRVEICINSRWGTMCSGGRTTTWNENGASVVCRQLGFDPETTRGIPTFGSFGMGSGPIFLNNIRCFGNEANLLQCPSSGIRIVMDCDHSHDVGVVCSNVPCLENAIQLKGGPEGVNSLGRLEVCVDGMFGAVSSKGFERSHAIAVCKQLGFQSRNFRLLQNISLFGINEGDVYSLTLSESGTTNGTKKLVGESHNRDVFLVCLGPFDECSPGMVRLVDGEDPWEGRVEVCLGNKWGTVCDDSWDRNSAAVVCKQLGLPSERVRVKSFGGNNNLTILLDDIKCSGNESDLLHCQGQLERNDCTHNEDAGVQCKPQPIPEEDGTSVNQNKESHLIAVTVPVLVLTIAIAAILAMIIILVVYKSRVNSLSSAMANSSFIIESGSDSLKISERTTTSKSEE